MVYNYRFYLLAIPKAKIGITCISFLYSGSGYDSYESSPPPPLTESMEEIDIGSDLDPTFQTPSPSNSSTDNESNYENYFTLNNVNNLNIMATEVEPKIIILNNIKLTVS